MCEQDDGSDTHTHTVMPYGVEAVLQPGCNSMSPIIYVLLVS